MAGLLDGLVDAITSVVLRGLDLDAALLGSRGNETADAVPYGEKTETDGDKVRWTVNMRNRTTRSSLGVSIARSTCDELCGARKTSIVARAFLDMVNHHYGKGPLLELQL